MHTAYAWSSSRQWSVALASPSANEKEAFGLFDGFGGALEMVGVGGAVPSTVTFGWLPCSSKFVASRASVVFHVYVFSVCGAVAANLIRSVPPGHSSLAAPGGATAWIATGAASSVTVQVAAEQLPAAVVVAPSVAASTANPAGTTTCPLFAAELELGWLPRAIVYVPPELGATAPGVIVAP